MPPVLAAPPALAATVALALAGAIARLLTGMENLTRRIRRRPFRTFVHEPSRMLAVLADHGLRTSVLHHGAWDVALAERGTA